MQLSYSSKFRVALCIRCTGGGKSRDRFVKYDKYRVCLELRLDELEQYGRRDCLEITGIPAAVNENPTKLVQELSEVTGVDLAESDISIAHRLHSTRKVKDRLIVKLNLRIKKQEIYASREKLKSKRVKDLPSIAGNPIFQSVMSNTRIYINDTIQETSIRSHPRVQTRIQIQILMDGEWKNYATRN